MPFSIQTNVNSLIAQENLRVNSNFQNQTIQRLTSGYRINSSGDDAAGLSIANKFRSDTAELTQGVRNANDGVAQLQIMDGGMNNIGKMLDRLKTLATQSSSGTFTGDRTVLNAEYQSLITEIDRQAQGIGLSTGGHFATKMGVYIGGGATAAGGADINNGTINLDLTNSVVDSKALGLRTSEFTAQTASGVNLAAASNTSIANIYNANSGDSGKATFQLSGAGFSGVTVSIDITTADTTKTLSDKLNAAIQAAGNSGTSDSANALRAANIQAKAVTDGSGNEQLAFTSATSAFQVTAGNNSANALLGQFDSSSSVSGTGSSVKQTVAGSSAVAADPAAYELVKLNVTVNDVTKTVTVKLDAADGSRNDVLQDMTDVEGNGYSDLQKLGVSAQINSTTHKLEFVGDSNQSIQVSAAGDTNNYLGLGTWKEGAGVVGHQDITTGTQRLARSIQVTVNDTEVDLSNFDIQATDTRADILSTIQSNGNYSQLQALGVEAQLVGNKLAFVGNAGQDISVSSLTDANDALGLGVSADINTVSNAEALTAANTTLSGHDVTGTGAIDLTSAIVNATIHVTVGSTTIDLTGINQADSGSGGNEAGVLSAATTGGNAAAYSQLQALGVTVKLNGGDTLAFVGDNGQDISVSTENDGGNALKLSGGGTSTARTGYTTSVNQGAAGDKATVAFSINGGDKILVSFTSTGNMTTTANALQDAINGNAELKAAGITVNTSTLAISAPAAASTGVTFRAVVEQQSGTLNLGLGTNSTTPAATFYGTDQAAMVSAAGSSETGLGNSNDVFSFTGLKNLGGGSAGSADQQVISFSTMGTDGTPKSTSIVLNADNADNVDSAVSELNAQLQQSDDANLRKIVAVKETNAAGTAEGIRFISSLNTFSVQVGAANNSTTTAPAGLYDGTAGATTKQGMAIQSSTSGAIDISTQAGAAKAVLALGSAVKILGSSQAAIGKGQNQLNYAIGLAQSQISNFSAAESRIRDADVASEAANLTKAQVLQQASMAAMAQANTAPQAVLSLLKG